MAVLAASRTSRLSRAASSSSRSRKHQGDTEPVQTEEDVARSSVRSSHRVQPPPRESINNDPFDETFGRSSMPLDHSSSAPVSRAASRQRSSSRREASSSRRQRPSDAEDDLSASTFPRPPGLPLGHISREPVDEDSAQRAGTRRSSSRRQREATDPAALGVLGLNDSSLAVPVASEVREEKTGRRSRPSSRRPQG